MWMLLYVPKTKEGKMDLDITKETNSIAVNGLVKGGFDLSDLEWDVLHWYGNENAGELEFHKRGHEKNEDILDIGPYMKYVEMWNAANDQVPFPDVPEEQLLTTEDRIQMHYSEVVLMRGLINYLADKEGISHSALLKKIESYV